jgi:putative ABC transport system permease protein
VSRWASRVIATIRRWFDGGTRDRALDAELESFLQHDIDERIDRGMMPLDARRTALASMGGIRQVTERTRAARTGAWFEALQRDLRYGVRGLRAKPGFAATVLASLALGLGASIAVFTVVDFVALRPLPFREPDRLMAVITTYREGGKIVERREGAPQDAVDYRARQDVFDGLAAFRTLSLFYIVKPGDMAEMVDIATSTADLFPVLGASPQLGRVFTADEEIAGRNGVAVISDRLWRRRFGADLRALGRVLMTGEDAADTSTAREIIGVMPPDFAFPINGVFMPDVWIPYVVPPQQKVRDGKNGRVSSIELVGRLAPGVSRTVAEARLRQIQASLAATDAWWFSDLGLRVKPLQEAIVGDTIRSWMLMLLGAVTCVLLLTCVNVANLVFARALARAHELSIRITLGATRGQVVRALAVEMLLLSLGGLLLGLLGAHWAVDVLRAAMPADIPRLATAAIDARVLLMAAGAALGAGLLLGVLPGLYLSRPDTAAGITGESRSHTSDRRTNRIRGVLVVAEVALAIMLAIGSGLFLSSFVRVLRQDIGIDYSHVVRASFTPRIPRDGAQDASSDARGLINLDVAERLGALPGVEGVAMVARTTPLTGSQMSYTLRIEGLPQDPNDRRMVDQHLASASYLDVVKLPLLRGRWFTDADRDAEPVVVINEATAETFLPGRDPLTVRLSYGPHAMRRVVGVVGNVRNGGPEADLRPEMYEPMTGRGAGSAEVLIRTTNDPRTMAAAIRAAIVEAAPMVSVEEPFTLSSRFDQLVATRRFLMIVLTIFGVSGVAVGGVGIYGVMAYIVSHQTKEIGIRMALGSSLSRIMWSVIKRAGRYLFAGMLIGVAVAWSLAGTVADLLFKVQPRDPVVFGAAVGLLGAVGLAAAWIPARRAAGTDPLLALRTD